MERTLIKILLNSTIVYLLAELLPGIMLGRFFDAIVFVLVFTLIQIFIKPLIIFLTLPITLLSFGLFYFLINGICVWLTAYLLPGIMIQSFWWAVLFSLLLSLIQTVLFKESYQHH
jgi:putative membrane protein